MLSTSLIAALAFIHAGGAAAPPDPAPLVVHVAPGRVNLDPPEPAGPESEGAASMEWEEGMSLIPLPTIPNYYCKAFDDGCPMGTKKIDSNGNFVGCTNACTGRCTTCSGSQNPIALCVKKADQSCALALPLVKCGVTGSGACGTTPTPTSGPPDNNGCYCTPPTTYPSDAEVCLLLQCLGAAP